MILDRLKDSPQLEKNRSEIASRISRWTEYNQAQQLAFEKTTSDEVVATEAEARIHASTLFQALAKSLPANSIIVDEMVSQVPYFTHYLFSQPDKQFQHCRGWQGGLGTGIGVALGAKMANPEKTVVCIVGDGAFNYNPIPVCFGLSQQEQLPIIIVVMNNSGYISQTWNFYNYFPEGAAVSTQYMPGAAIDPSPNYSMMPQAWNGIGKRIESKDELSRQLDEALKIAESQFVVLDVNVAP